MSKNTKIDCDNCSKSEIGREFNMSNGARITVYGDSASLAGGTNSLDICADCLQQGLALSLHAALGSYSVIKIAKGVAKNESIKS